MTLAHMESRFFELKGKLAVGLLAEDEFKREMEKLRFQDAQGRWWMIGAQSGRWYYYDGARWLLGQPPEIPASAESSASGPAPEPPRVAMPPASTSKATKPLWKRASAQVSDTAPSSQPPASITPTARIQTSPVPPPTTATQPVTPPLYTPPPKPAVTKRLGEDPARTRQLPPLKSEPREAPPYHRQTLKERVQEEMSHVHMPDVHMPDVHEVHVPEVHAPTPLRRFPPMVILFGAIAVGLVLVALMWVAVDNLVPGKPISSFLGRNFASATATPAVHATALPPGANNVDNLIRIGDELTSKSQFAPALTQYQNASKLAPNNVDIYTHWARALALTGRIQDAVNTAQRATRLDDKNAEAFAQLTRALAWSGQSDAAVSAGEKATQLDAKNATAQAFLAEAYLRAGRPEDGAKAAETAVSLDDKNADAHRAAGWVAVLGGKKDEAVTEWQRVVEIAPDIFFYHYEFGQVYGAYLNDAASAIPEYQKAIQLFPPYVPSYTALGRMYLAQKQPGQAILQYQKALTFDSNSNDAFVGLGLSFQMQDKCGQAIPYFQKSLELNPNGNEAQRGIADCNAVAKGQPAPAATAAMPTPNLGAVPTAIVQATVVPLANATPSPATAKATPGTSASPAGAKNEGRIAFSTFDGQYHLYLSNPDGSNRTSVRELASDPAFSPDGSQLLYYSWEKSERGIHRMESNGKEDEFISLRMEDLLPSWAPDGTRYVYATRAGQGSDMTKRAYRLRIADPTARANQDPADFVVGQYPAWGPKRIVFRDCGFPTESCGLAVINPDGSGKKSLTNINSTAPTWSPDGSKIVFMSDYGNNWDIYIVDSDGGSPSRLTTDPAEDGLPTFSPDGKQIAYLSHRDGKWAIWAMGLDGSNQHKLFDLGGEPAGAVAGNSSAQPAQVWYEQRISWH